MRPLPYEAKRDALLTSARSPQASRLHFGLVLHFPQSHTTKGAANRPYRNLQRLTATGKDYLTTL